MNREYLRERPRRSACPPVVGTRDELTTVVEAAVRPGEPDRLLVVFRIARMDEFADRFGENAMERMAEHIAVHLPNSSGRWTFYFRPRRDELCLMIEGPLNQVDQALAEASTTVSEALGPEGITLGYSQTLLPSGLGSFTEAIARADRGIVNPNGEPVPRSYRSGWMTLR